MNKNIFFYVAIPIIYLLLFTILVISANAQTRRTLWHGNAAVEGDFDAVGGSISGEAISATGDITAANDMIIGASEVAIDIDGLEPTQDNYVLMLDYLNNKISLEEVTASSLASLSNIEDVTIATPVDGEFLGYNGTYWGNVALALEDISDVSIAATPGMGSVFTWDADIDKAEFKSHISIPIYSITIGSATSFLFGDGSNITNLPSGGVAALEDIGDVTITSATDGQVLEYDAALPGWINATSSGGASTLSDLTDVNISGPALNEVLAYDGSQWINQVMSSSGGGGGSAELIFDFIIAATDSVNAASADIVCDGTADNESIQYAIDLVSNNGGGNILLLNGSYAISGQITIADASDNITISGSHWTKTVLNRQYTGGSMLYVYGDYCIIENLCLHGGRGTYSGATDNSLTLNSSYSFLLDRVYFYRSAYSGLYMTGVDLDNSVIKNSTFYGGGNSNIYAYDTLNSDNVLIDTIISMDSANDGLEFSNTNQGVNWKIANSYFMNNNYYGIRGERIVAALISNCNIFNNSYGMRILKDSFITGCYVHDNINVGIYIGSGNVVEACSIYNNGTTGIEIINSGHNSSIVGNTIMNNGITGVYINASDYCRIESNIIRGNTNYGVNVGNLSDSSIICNNTFSYNGYGIVLGNYNCIYDNKVINNVFQDNVTSNIVFPGYANRCKDSYIINNVYIDSDGTQTSVYSGAYDEQYFSNNIALGAINRFSNTIGGPSSVKFRNNMLTPYGAAGEVQIISSSATAKVGYATDDPTTITNVITVGSGATTDPIANNWATWSDPALKENIEPVDAAVQEVINKDFDGYDLISYDWKYPYPAPAVSNFKDIIDDKGAIVSTAKEQYTKELEEYTTKKSAWYAKRNRYKSWALDLNSIPDDVAAYTEEGQKIGYNINQIVMRLIAVLKREKARINHLEQRISALEAARK